LSLLRLVCVLSQKKSTLSFSSLSANPFLWRPLIFHMPCLVRLSLIFFLNGTIDFVISFRTSWTIFWLAKTSNKPISITTWLAVDPYTCKLIIDVGSGFTCHAERLLHPNKTRGMAITTLGANKVLLQVRL